MSDKKVGITTDHLSHTQWRCCKEGFFIKNHWMEENTSSTVKCPGQQLLRQVVTKARVLSRVFPHWERWLWGDRGSNYSSVVVSSGHLWSGPSSSSSSSLPPSLPHSLTLSLSFFTRWDSQFGDKISLATTAHLGSTRLFLSATIATLGKFSIILSTHPISLAAHHIILIWPPHIEQQLCELFICCFRN